VAGALQVLGIKQRGLCNRAARLLLLKRAPFPPPCPSRSPPHHVSASSYLQLPPCTMTLLHMHRLTCSTAHCDTCTAIPPLRLLCRMWLVPSAPSTAQRLPWAANTPPLSSAYLTVTAGEGRRMPPAWPCQTRSPHDCKVWRQVEVVVWCRAGYPVGSAGGQWRRRRRRRDRVGLGSAATARLLWSCNDAVLRPRRTATYMHRACPSSALPTRERVCLILNACLTSIPLHLFALGFPQAPAATCWRLKGQLTCCTLLSWPPTKPSVRRRGALLRPCSCGGMERGRSACRWD
jgi:hypothetical protein